MSEQHVIIRYTNWREETEERKVKPLELYFGTHDKHPEPQWILRAFCEARGAERHFAMLRISSWKAA